jgi:dUTP pyrophosphatase
MFRSGRYVADRLPGEVADDQVQPNGVDLRLGAVFEPLEPGRVGRDGKSVGARQARTPEEREDDLATYYLPPGGYVVRYADRVRIPEGHVGFIYPRSTLLRNACMLNTAVWDAGYEGVGEGLLQVHHDVELEEGARIAQLVLAQAEPGGVYDGSYQGENIDDWM